MQNKEPKMQSSRCENISTEDRKTARKGLFFLLSCSQISNLSCLKVREKTRHNLTYIVLYDRLFCMPISEFVFNCGSTALESITNSNSIVIVML